MQGRDLDEPSRVFYRIVTSDPPSRRDFLSNDELGKTLVYDNPEARRLWKGISVYDSRRHARQRARKSPWLGQLIAILRIPRHGDIAFARTGRGHGHYTVWADADVLLAHVDTVFSVDEPHEHLGGPRS